VENDAVASDTPAIPLDNWFLGFISQKKYILISMGYSLVVFDQRNTTSCGPRGNFQNFDVHNLFIWYSSDTNSCLLLLTKKRGEFDAPPLFIETLSSRIYYRITLLRSLADCPL
jgi:hypothetical protein